MPDIFDEVEEDLRAERAARLWQRFATPAIGALVLVIATTASQQGVVASGSLVIDGPALFLTGALSHYVRPEHREVIRALFPKARFARIPEAGHWLHADAPRAFEDTVRIFLDSPDAA